MFNNKIIVIHVSSHFPPLSSLLMFLLILLTSKGSMEIDLIGFEKSGLFHVSWRMTPIVNVHSLQRHQDCKWDSCCLT